MEVGIVILILAALIVAGYASAKFVYSLTEENTKTTDLKVSDKNPLIQVNQDFSSKMEGTLSGWTDEKYYKEPIDETIVLFSSEKIPGLTLIYYHYENKIIGGTPQMTADNIIFFDGNPHTVKYSFKKNGKQQLYYDNNLVAESDFIFHSNYLTGNIIGVNEFEISDSFESVVIDEKKS